MSIFGKLLKGKKTVAVKKAVAKPSVTKKATPAPKPKPKGKGKKSK